MTDDATAAFLVPTGRLVGDRIGVAEGDVGRVEDVYFDDRSWTVRYLVVAVGTWLSGRRVLLSPHSVLRLDVDGGRLLTSLTREGLLSLPEPNQARPVSRQDDAAFVRYYGFPYCWGYPHGWGPVPVLALPPMAVVASPLPEETTRTAEGPDPHLRSAGDMRGHGIRALDGDRGHLEDFLLEPRSWTIHYVVVDPHRLWPGSRVVIATDWITWINWSERVVRVDVRGAVIRRAPRYRPGMWFGSDFEQQLRRVHDTPDLPTGSRHVPPAA